MCGEPKRWTSHLRRRRCRQTTAYLLLDADRDGTMAWHGQDLAAWRHAPHARTGEADRHGVAKRLLSIGRRPQADSRDGRGSKRQAHDDRPKRPHGCRATRGLWRWQSPATQPGRTALTLREHAVPPSAALLVAEVDDQVRPPAPSSRGFSPVPNQGPAARRVRVCETGKRPRTRRARWGTHIQRAQLTTTATSLEQRLQ